MKFIATTVRQWEAKVRASMSAPVWRDAAVGVVCVCNLYSMTTNVEAIRRLFQVNDNKSVKLNAD
jgi:hypothetical protein